VFRMSLRGYGGSGGSAPLVGVAAASAGVRPPPYRVRWRLRLAPDRLEPRWSGDWDFEDSQGKAYARRGAGLSAAISLRTLSPPGPIALRKSEHPLPGFFTEVRTMLMEVRSAASSEWGGR